MSYSLRYTASNAQLSVQTIHKTMFYFPNISFSIYCKRPISEIALEAIIVGRILEIASAWTRQNINECRTRYIDSVAKRTFPLPSRKPLSPSRIVINLFPHRHIAEFIILMFDISSSCHLVGEMFSIR